MNRPLTLLLAAMLLSACTAGTPSRPSAASADTKAAAAARIEYPKAARGDTADDYHGTKVADPYRWLENLDAPETKAWIEAENRVTQDYLADTPREAIKAKLAALWNYERFGVPESHGGRYFYTRNDGLQNQAPVYVQQGLESAPRLLLDPNTLSPDGTVALSESAASDDGKRFAYSLSDGGSDWRTIKVRDVDSGKDLGDEIHWAKFTAIAWSRDGKGFYYQRYDEPQSGNQLKAVN
jgi:prolyl oligopeptidase